MTYTTIILLLIPISVILWWIILAYKYSHPRKLPKAKLNFLLKEYKKILQNNNPKHSIIDIDKMYHKVLLQIWHKWSFWEVLKKEPKEIWDINKIWELHKIRNKLVHDFDAYKTNFLKQKRNEYKKEMETLFKKIS
jgi:hypothetical protein